VSTSGVRDLLVAGAGPAGLAAAVAAAEAGMRVTVVEPRAGPQDKACGEGLMPPAVTALAALGVHPEGHPFAGIRYTDGRGAADAYFRDGPGRGVRRPVLHAALAARAACCGVEVVPGRVTDVRQDADGVTAAGLRGRWLVAADGLHSPVRRSLGLDAPPSGPRRYGLRRHHTCTPWSDLVEVHWAPDAEAYVTPVGADTVGVAVLFRHDRVRGARSRGRPSAGPGEPGGFPGWLARFPALAARLEGVPAGPVAGAGPLRQRARRRVAGRVLLVGDAAGYTDALTGEGVALGVRAARAAVACLADGDPGRYEGEWRRLSWRYRALTSALVAATRPAAPRRLLVPAAAHLPSTFSRAVHVLAH
jgi:flavin-dependent dehydrogenase